MSDTVSKSLLKKCRILNLPFLRFKIWLSSWSRKFIVEFSSAKMRWTASEFKIRQIFFGAERSGGAVLAKISGAERSGGAVPSKKFGAERSGGAEISKNFDFFGVFHKFFANYCSRGTKTLTYYSWRSRTVFRHLFDKFKVQNPLCVQKFTWSGAERWSGVSKNRCSNSAPLRSAQNPLHRSTDFEPCQEELPRQFLPPQ